MKRILTINPGSTSTKISVFEDTKVVFETTITHKAEEIKKYDKITDQYEFRKDLISNIIKDNGFKIEDFDCIVGRGGILKPIEGGTYLVNDKMLEDLKNATLEHASNLGAMIANALSKTANCKAFIVDPVVVDELEEIARISGHKDFERKSIHFSF